MTQTASVRVNLDPGPYDIHIGAGLLAGTFGALLELIQNFGERSA